MYFGQLRGWALGKLRISRSDFYEMRLGEFFEALHAYSEEKEMDRRHSGELARGASLRLFNLQLKSSSRIKDPAKFWRMPWDENHEEEEMEEVHRLNNLTGEESFREAQRLLAKFGNGNGNSESQI